MWYAARAELALSCEEWLELTPRHFHGLMQHARRLMRFRDTQNALLAVTVANFSAYPPKKPFPIEMFQMLPPEKELIRSAPPPPPVDVIAGKLRKFFGGG